ncbi:hypothetical protein [Citreimonas salinaria]|uniref:Uncharacterized protein n=1 Tax=Citreimonas salinaria TaxID=321339 RepID=A0A1H3NEZ2_9RHOB|nr:hypothetical protein [Citreimonas salinaria]SDY87303.1 hypothetical protein SAMN05444340_12330 [Citreimonas salinaria]
MTVKQHLPRERSRAAVALTSLALGALVVGVATKRRPPISHPSRDPRATPARAARNTRRGASLLAASVLADSAVEHYRGGYHHKAMFAAPVAAGTTLAATLCGERIGRRTQRGIFHAAVVAGLAGHFFHARNIMRRPGALSWESLFYAAPIGAPGALLLAGRAGRAALRLERPDPREGTRRQVGRRLAFGTTLGLLGTTAEVALLHFRGSFHNPIMYTPVIMPTLAAIATADVVRGPSRRRLRRARILLRATALMGLAGTAFHAWGIHRNMGGWRNWSQNLQVAPPLPAPPSFTGVAIAGLGTIDLLESEEAR